MHPSSALLLLHPSCWCEHRMKSSMHCGNRTIWQSSDAVGDCQQWIRYCCPTLAVSISLQAAPEVALDVLLCIAEEAACLDSRRQAPFVQKAMQPQASATCTCMGRILHTSLQSPGPPCAASFCLAKLWIGFEHRDIQFSFPLCLPACLPPSLPPSLTHSLTHSLTQSLTHSLIHSLTHPPTHPLIHSLTHPLTHSLTLVSLSRYC